MLFIHFFSILVAIYIHKKKEASLPSHNSRKSDRFVRVNFSHNGLHGEYGQKNNKRQQLNLFLYSFPSNKLHKQKIKKKRRKKNERIKWRKKAVVRAVKRNGIHSTHQSRVSMNVYCMHKCAYWRVGVQRAYSVAVTSVTSFFADRMHKWAYASVA